MVGCPNPVHQPPSVNPIRKKKGNFGLWGLDKQLYSTHSHFCLYLSHSPAQTHQEQSSSNNKLHPLSPRSGSHPHQLVPYTFLQTLPTIPFLSRTVHFAYKQSSSFLAAQPSSAVPSHCPSSRCRSPAFLIPHPCVTSSRDPLGFSRPGTPAPPYLPLSR